MGQVHFNLVLCSLNAGKQNRLVQKPTIAQDRYLGHVSGIKAGFHTFGIICPNSLGGIWHIDAYLI
jgi:hypothetical protein